MIRQLWDMFWDLLYPPKCMFCSKLLKRKEKILCNECLSVSEQISEPIVIGGEFECCHSVFRYKDNVASVIKQYKFSEKIHYARSMGILLADMLQERQMYADVITWAPVSSKRKRKRGYDQGQELAKIVGQQMGIPVKRLLKKVRHNAAQAMIHDDAARKANVKNVYAVPKSAKVAGKRILLLDDVITSGATLAECSKTLRAAGAQTIICATFSAAREDHTSL